MNFRDFLLARGLLPGSVVADGRWRRCPTEDHPRKKNGAYKLSVDGAVGFCQNHALDSAPHVWRPERVTEAPAFDPEALRRANADARRRLLEATEAARAFYAKCAPLRGGHPYLEAHGLGMEGCYGLKVDRDGWMVVPAVREGKLMSVQRIGPEGEKRFWPGASVKGASYVVERKTASITVVCEGLATGLAIFAAAPLTRIVCAFNAGNLAKVAVPATGMLIIAADNDRETEGRIGSNPGLTAAREAAEAFGVPEAVAVPEGILGTDWCDWRQERLVERSARLLPRQTISDARRAVDAEIAVAVMLAARFRSA